MTIEQILTDITAALGALGVLCSILAYLPFPAKWAERFARFAIYAANAKFSVNVRSTLPKEEPNILPRFPGAVALLFAVGFALHSSACASSQAGACDPADAVRITEKYRASMSVQCKGYTFADCPHRGELETQRDKELEAACSSK